MTAPLDLAALREVAEKATPGPRENAPPGSHYVKQSTGLIFIVHSPADAEFAAACDRETVLALLDRLSTAEQECERLRGAVVRLQPSAQVLADVREDRSHEVSRLARTVNRLMYERDAALCRAESAESRLATVEQEQYLRGINASIARVESRQRHYELSRDGTQMRTKPITFAIIEEILVFLRALRERAMGTADPRTTLTDAGKEQ